MAPPLTKSSGKVAPAHVDKAKASARKSEEKKDANIANDTASKPEEKKNATDTAAEKDEKPKTEEAEAAKEATTDTQTKESAGASRKSKSIKVKKVENDEKMKNGCQKCCGNIMKWFAHDAIYGSFVGPHAVSFLCLCALCKKRSPCFRKCSRPLCVASLATKLMNFIMLGIITLLATFFIIPWPTSFLSHNSTVISSFYPCNYGKMIRYKDANGGCENHAGYFMAYRCFFAYATLMLINCLLMIRVSNTTDDPYRSRLHHGFWLYKYIFLMVLLIIYFLMVNGARDREGVFEFVASVIGNICHLCFSLVEITFIMDLVEIWVFENKTGGGKWSTFIYWANTTLIFIVSIIFYIKIWLEFSNQRVYHKNVPDWPPWPLDNCEEGYPSFPDWKHTGLILGSTGVIMLLIIVMAFRKIFRIDKRFPYSGWLQTAVMTLFNLGYLWSALMNSSNIHSRPHCNVGFEIFAASSPRQRQLTEILQKGSWDVYFEGSGLFHGLLVVASLFYFAFVHGPRCDHAPLSILYSWVFQIADRIPVYPDEDDAEFGLPLGYLQAIDQSTVWDDEQVSVAQSWSHFYLMMLFGSLSLMMAMTNFTNPWAADHYNSSNVAFYSKFGTAIIATLIYIIMLISNCKTIQTYGTLAKTVRRKSIRELLEFDFEDMYLDDEDELGGLKSNAFKFHLAGMGRGRTSEEVDVIRTLPPEPPTPDKPTAGTPS